MSQLPVFWSFRRCPYAIRARLAIQASGVPVTLREILLRDKPQAFLDTSASGTVPALRDGPSVLDESLDIMLWALRQNDPEGLLDMDNGGWALITQNDGPFKAALDHTKYAVRFPNRSMEVDRQAAADVLIKLDQRLGKHGALTGPKPKIADMAILPFVRQFANIDREWFDGQNWPHLRRWLDTFLASPDFAAIMVKHPVWAPDQEPLIFP